MSTTATALLSELEDLRKVLDSKSPLGTTPMGLSSVGAPSGNGMPHLGMPTPTGMSTDLKFQGTSRDFSRSTPPMSRPSGVHFAATPGSEYMMENNTMSGYTAALSDAEANVDRLSRAMEAAEEEMENTFKRTTELHRSTAERREAEILELRKILAAKERSIDSLRETLTSTKRSLEARAGQAEQAQQAAHQDVQRLLQEVRRLKQEGVQAKQEGAALQGEVGGLRAAMQGLDQEKYSQDEQLRTVQRQHRESLESIQLQHQEQHANMKTQLHRLQAEYATLQATLEHEITTRDMKLDTVGQEVDAGRQEADAARHEADAARREAETARRELHTARLEIDHLQEKLHAEQEGRREALHRLEVERKKRKLQGKQCLECTTRVNDIAMETKVRTSELERRLKEEQRTRLGAEKWLQAELKSKEELEHMFCNLRDMVLKKDSNAEIDQLKQAVIGLQKSKHSHKAKCHRLREYDDTLRTSLERENDRLREELGQAQRQITKKLYSQPCVDREPCGDLLARCRRCHNQFNLSKPPENACGYHPGDLTAHGFGCCGVIPKQGSAPVYCHWRPHVA
uniref:Uncharacterized protein n=1 Tax=Polyblepharides amylifera TaxID=1486889 RepID=A0A7R9SVW2_9CHLO|mmetsp:Transcript_44/g.56  ORF Transcript_44/g.56 Transcript_44/m.56 type:complete len:570 (+) Transcript_44:235-1944(+)